MNGLLLDVINPNEDITENEDEDDNIMIEANLAAENIEIDDKYKVAIEKVRKIAGLLRHSPRKAELL